MLFLRAAYILSGYFTALYLSDLIDNVLKGLIHPGYIPLRYCKPRRLKRQSPEFPLTVELDTDKGNRKVSHTRHS